MAKCSIIIPSWFSWNHKGKYGEHETFYIASECLCRLLNVTDKKLFELILIDNGSDLFDKDIVILDEPIRFRPTWYWEQADILIKNKENLGFTKSVNQGINLARGEFVIVVNNDIIFWEGWLEQMIKDFECLEKDGTPVGLLMPALEKSGIKFPDILNLKKEDIKMENMGKWGEKAEFGSCFMGRKELFTQVAKNRDGYQVLDEKFGPAHGGQDRWLYREIRMLGGETYRTHNVRVGHVGCVTVGKIDKEERRKVNEESRQYLQELKNKFNVN